MDHSDTFTYEHTSEQWQAVEAGGSCGLVIHHLWEEVIKSQFSFSISVSKCYVIFGILLKHATFSLMFIAIKKPKPITLLFHLVRLSLAHRPEVGGNTPSVHW